MNACAITLMPTTSDTRTGNAIVLVRSQRNLVYTGCRRSGPLWMTACVILVICARQATLDLVTEKMAM